MKIKFLLSLFLGSALSMSAQGYLDGVEYYRADQFSAAKTILERTLNEASTDRATSHYYLGQVAMEFNDKETAKSNFEKGVAANPENPYNYVGLAAVALANGDKKAADENVKKAKSLGKKDAQLLVDIARVYFNADAVAYDKDIQKAMKEALKADKESAAYFIFIGDTIALNVKNNEDAGKAAANYDNAIYYDPNSAVAYVKYSNLYKKVAPQFSIDKMREYIKTNPNSILARRELANRLYDLGRWTQAVEAFGPVVTNSNHLVEDEERYATLLLAGENYEEAYQVAKAVLGRTENPNQMYRIMMHSKSSLEDYTEAAKWAQELLKSKGVAKIVDIDHLTYGSILEGLAANDAANAATHYAEAIAQYDEALKVNDKCYDAYKSKSSLYNKMGDFVNAVASFEAFMATGEAKAGDYHTYAGRLLNYANNVSKTDEAAAVAIYDKAAAAATTGVERSNSPYAQERKAIILFSKNSGMAEEVAVAFEKVVELLDSNPSYASDSDTYKTALGQLGDYYSRIGQNEKAIAAYERYLKYAPENNKVRERIEYLKTIPATEE